MARVKIRPIAGNYGMLTILPNELYYTTINILCNKTRILNWLQFLFVVKAVALKQQISQFYPQILSTEVFYDRPLTNINVIANDRACIKFANKTVGTEAGFAYYIFILLAALLKLRMIVVERRDR